jgi:hypothetical protein
MNSSALPLSDSAARPLEKTKRRGRPRKSVTAPTAKTRAPEREYAAVGTLTRTKSLLNAALRVWELKQRGPGTSA